MHKYIRSAVYNMDNYANGRGEKGDYKGLWGEGAYMQRVYMVIGNIVRGKAESRKDIFLLFRARRGEMYRQT